IAVVTVDLLFAAPAKFLLHTELPQPRLPVAGRADADEPRRRTRFLPPVSLGDNSRPRTQQRASGQRGQRLLQEAAAVGGVGQDEVEGRPAPAPGPAGRAADRVPRTPRRAPRGRAPPGPAPRCRRTDPARPHPAPAPPDY